MSSATVSVYGKIHMFAWKRDITSWRRVGVLGVENRVVNKMLRKFPQYLEEALTLAF